MDPKRIRLFVIAAAVPIAFVALVSLMGGSGTAGNGGGSGKGVARTTSGPTGTPKELTIADLLVNPTPANGGVATPKLPKPDEAVITDLVDQGNRAYTSGDLARARGFYAKALKLDPGCERCGTKLESLEKQMLLEIKDAFRAGEGYINSGRYDQAILYLERVLVLDPDTSSVYHINAKTLIEDAKLKKAETQR